MPGNSLCTACGQRTGGQGAGGQGAVAQCRNSWCALPDRPLEAVYWVGRYDGSLKKAIVAYKYRADLRWAKVFGGLLHAFLARHATWFEEYAVVCPVPSFAGASAHRRWGHVELVCEELSRLAGAGWPVQELVVKTAETGSMSAKQRGVRQVIARRELSRALAVPRGSEVEGRRVIVVDDVCASGETLLAMAKVLRGAGAAEVTGLVLARAAWRSH